MDLEDLGYNRHLDRYLKELGSDDFQIGRVVAEHRERYIVKTATKAYEAEITGNMRFSAKDREDFPAVGDWVVLLSYESDFAIIHSILPRFSTIKRKAAGESGAIQVIAANIDYAFLIQAADRDFNLNRLDRYLTLCNASGVRPIIVLTKIDLAERAQLLEISRSIEKRIEGVPILFISNKTLEGYDALMKFLDKGRTYCMLGSSGIGKSTLLNNLCGHAVMETGAISPSTNKGRHVTSHRELVVLESGAILIDNPGMREVGIADAANGLEITFDRIAKFSRECKYSDCSHTRESGCAVLAALERGEIELAEYENYLKMERERAFFDSSLEERKQKEKAFGKIMKNYKKEMKNKHRP